MSKRDETREAVARALFSQSVYHGYDRETLQREWVRTQGLHLAAADAALKVMAPGSRFTVEGVEMMVVDAGKLQRLLSAAKLCYGQSEGCAVNHYGEDFATHGMPGWLVDAAADIAEGSAMLRACEEPD